MNQDVAIEVQHISKSFKISYDKSKTLKDKIIFARKINMKFIRYWMM